MYHYSKKPYLQFLYNGDVILNLPNVSGKRKRLIGNIDKVRRTFYSSPKNKRKHLFKKTKSLGFPYDLVYKKKRGFIYLCVNYENKKLWTSVIAVKTYGDVMHFKKQGFETQIFLKLKQFKKTKQAAMKERQLIKKGVAS